MQALAERETLGEMLQLTRSTAFARLFTVDIRNAFYLTKGDPGTIGSAADFGIAPALATQQAMPAFELLFRRSPEGFFVAYNQGNSGALRRYLSDVGRLQSSPSASHLRNFMSFFLTVEQPEFFNFTDLPTDFSTIQTCYYASNLLTDPEDARLRLSAGYLSGARPFNVVTGQETVPFAPGADAIEVLDAAGTVVYCYPHSIPVAMLTDARTVEGADFLDRVEVIQCADVQAFLDAGGNPEAKEMKTCEVTFQYLPQGKYTIRQVGKPAFDTQVIYRKFAASAFCLVDIFLSQPDDIASEPGNYPVTGVSSAAPQQAQIEPKRYALDFSARATRWIYYFVPPKGSRLDELSIFDDSDGRQPLRITPPEPVRIGSGQTAWRCVLLDPIELRNVPAQRFRLDGRLVRPDGEVLRLRTLVSTLPVASAQRISLEPVEWLTPAADETAGTVAQDQSAQTPSGAEVFEASQIYVYL
jgi:hypothetical protein